MKKPIILSLLCAVLFFMPALCALPIKTVSISKEEILTLPDYDGTFIGGYGFIYKENEEWQFAYDGYLGGVYKNNGKYTILYGYIYNFDKEHIGNITLLAVKSVLIGKINNMMSPHVPVVGFLLTKEDSFFIGRLMSLFGPAPHIWGKFTPN